LACGAALLTLKREHLTENRAIIAWSAAILILVIAHLVPLPPQIWQMLPGRQIIVQIDDVTGIGPAWRPLSMAPEWTRNALWSLATPLAVILFAIQLSARELRLALTSVGLVVVLSAILAVAQLASDPKGPLYPYAVTNNGSAVGLFANRNHQALLLAAGFPLLGLWLAQLGARRRTNALVIRLAWICGALFIIASLLVNGSRSGLVMGICAAVMTWGLSRVSPDPVDQPAQARTMRWLTWGGGGILLVALIASAVSSDRAIVLNRLMNSELVDDARIRNLPATVEMLRDVFPWGSGIGSFQPVFQIYESDAMISSVYMNHAHNDWIEAIATGGAPAGILLLAFMVLVFYQTFALARRTHSDRLLGGTGLILLLLCAIGSLSDYPVRVPAIAVLMALGLVCLRPPRLQSDGATVQVMTQQNRRKHSYAA
jgi:O-antigen ligase